MKKYCVCNNEGDLIAHDIQSKKKAELICSDIQKKEPDAEWEVIEQ